MDQQTTELIKEAWLRYISDATPWITRRAAWKHWKYFDPSGKLITDEKIIARANKLVLPPAWQSVWISPIANWHLQATWLDTKWRKQYRYHPERTKARSQSKFYRMKDFGKELPKIRESITHALAQKDLTKTKVLALALTIMDKTGIRVGNEIYEHLYGSFGLTTLHNKHATITWDTIQFQFTGKKWVKQKIALKNRKLTRIIQQCKDLPWYHLFEFIDQNGEVKTIVSDDINDYIKTLSGKEFTAKDFRTWHGTVHALVVLSCSLDSEEKMTLPQLIDEVAKELGNTRTVCKKYYIHPIVFSAFEDEDMLKYIGKFCATCKEDNAHEKLLYKLLERE